MDDCGAGSQGPQVSAQEKSIITPTNGAEGWVGVGGDFKPKVKKKKRKQKRTRWRTSFKAVFL